MPRNGTGTYSLPAGQPVVTGTIIDSAVFNTFTNDVAATLTASIAKDGQTTPSANLPMGGFKHTGIADGTARTQYASIAQAQDSTATLIVGVAGVDTITGSPSVAVPAYVTGQAFRFAPAGNNTGATTINVSSLGAKNIIKGATGVALAAGDLATGVIATIVYNGTSFYLQNPASNAAGAFLAADGAAGTPSYSFSSDTNTGIYRVTTDYGGFTANGVFQGGWNVNGMTLKDGTAPLPSLAFDADPDTGIYRGGANQLNISAGGVSAGFVDGSGNIYWRDGTVALPAYSFSNDADTGIYRVAGNNLRVTAGNLDICGFGNGAGIAIMQPFGVINAVTDGTAGAPVYSFNNDADTGVYRVGANELGFAAGAARQLSVRVNSVDFYTAGAGGGTLAAQVQASQSFWPDGSAAAPGIAFLNDADTGVYRSGTNAFGVATAGAVHLNVDDNGATPLVQVSKGTLRLADGAVGLPALNFSADTNTGFYRVASDDFAAVTGGTIRMEWTSTSIVSTLPILNQDGLVGTPAYTFAADASTGFYRIGSGNAGYSAAGAKVFEFSAAASGGAKVADFGSTMQTVGFREIPQNIQNANYTAVLADSAKHILHGNGAGAGHTFTIPANASVAYAIGTAIMFVNRDSNTLSIAITSDSMLLANTALTGTRTLAANGIATALKVAATTWMISGTGVS